MNEEEYARFREFAEEHGLSLKEASHEALIEWVERQQQADPNDAAFTVLDDLDDSSLPRTAQTDAREEDDLVDEWHGNDESFVLAEDPSSNTCPMADPVETPIGTVTPNIFDRVRFVIRSSVARSSSMRCSIRRIRCTPSHVHSWILSATAISHIGD
ncbi:hypothetical protein ACFQL0_18290 [Haloplanus litoreus]|uniref:hypothetical protein n=1 Tax=Haloplanus litoreus TaxID=767515 RepID=UPI0036075FF4